MAEEKKEHKKHHGFTHTHIEHFKDGSASVHHVHHEGPHKDVKHAAADLDAVHDSMQDHLGEGPDEIQGSEPQAAGVGGSVPSGAASAMAGPQGA